MLRCEVVRWSAASALFLCTAALACEDPVGAPEADKSPFEQAVEDLRSEDPDRRIYAAGRLKREPLTLRDRLTALTLAATASAAETYDADVGAHLVGAASRQADDEVLEVIERLFDDYSIHAKHAALRTLGRLESRAAAEAWMRIVIPRLGTDRIGAIDLGTLSDKPRHADVFLPTVLQYIEDEENGWNLAMLGLRMCRSQPIGTFDLSTALPTIQADYARHHEALRPKQRRAKTNFRFQDEAYRADRAWASLLLDIMGCFERNDVERTLGAALDLEDPRLQYFALASRLRQGAYLKRQHLLEVASNPETRAWLFEALQDAGRLELMPEHLMTQEALAESELVRWLIRDLAFGVVPSEIVREDIVSLDTHSEIGVVDYYVFKFRAVPPDVEDDTGWLAGVAGGYRRDLTPTTQSDGQTGSAFLPIDTQSAEGHVGNLDVLYQRWREGVETYDDYDYE